MNPTIEEIQDDEAAFDGALMVDDFVELEPITKLEEAIRIHQMILPSLVTRLYLFLFGEVDKEQADAFIVILKEKYLENPEYYEAIFSLKVPSLLMLYQIGMAEDQFEDQGLGDTAMVYMTTRDKIQELYQPVVQVTE